MQWEQLFTIARSNDSTRDLSAAKIRNSFIKDYDRIIFSSGFRRLQNKTQVFPLPGPVFVHNRLTHSLEVASVGRSLGNEIGMRLQQKHLFTGDAATFYNFELGDVIAAACLAHDIGNPPFGHSGEDAIRSFFLENEKEPAVVQIKEALSENQWHDLIHFEGNANAFRMLTHKYNDEPSPYNLTLTTLAAIVKYPCTSACGFHKKSGLISQRKSGFFDAETAQWQKVADTLQIPALHEGQVWARHPFVYLTEAADDICYRVIDLEDAHRLGIISYRELEQLLLPFFPEGDQFGERAYLSKKLCQFSDDNQKAQYLRALWIGVMIQEISSVFIRHENQLLNGNLQTSLLEILDDHYQPHFKAIHDISVEKIYNYRPVAEIEIAGFQVIGDLLRMFINAILYPDKPRSKKLLLLLPENLKPGHADLYTRILRILDYISGMTDLYAIDLYRKTTGITLSNI